MSRKVRVYPGSDLGIRGLTPWSNIEVDESLANELWIDINQISKLDFSKKYFHNIDLVCFYDFFHAFPRLSNKVIDIVTETSQRYPTIWYTCNAKSIPNVNCIRFDYLWNRSKWATLEGRTGWKHASNGIAYQRSPLTWNKRNKKYLSLNRTITNLRSKLINCLSKYDGYLSNCSKNIVLGNKFVSDIDIKQGVTVPPDYMFFSNSYISCQVESQYTGVNSVIFTEKTYDHLVRDRIVLNFGPCGFYKALENDGWKLPIEIDISWDQELDTDKRFDGYIGTMQNLLDKSLDQLHDWFMINQDVVEHNYNMLENKPYNYIL
jgi:hypothetical protein